MNFGFQNEQGFSTKHTNRTISDQYDTKKQKGNENERKGNQIQFYGGVDKDKRVIADVST